MAEASARTQNGKASEMNEKVQNWTNLTQQLIKTIFGELYASRIVNLVSKVQFTQSGKLFYALEKKSKIEG